MSRIKLKQKMLKKGTPYKCSICEIFEWQGQKLSLHLDHINGDNKNDDESNLRFLCPNCHSLTHTYCGKNNKSGFGSNNKKVTDEVLLKSMNECYNVKDSLTNVGLSGAANYQRVYRLAQKNNIIHMMEPKLKNKILSKNLKESNIDFSVFGWVEEASKVIGIKSQKTRAWIARNCPEILEHAFLRRG
tara:strand:+ start:108 stop:671 length:564 start_codon:yes stop_codon:yes gene_type:complete